MFQALLIGTTSAFAISAPIHISGTGGEGVFIRPEPNTSRPPVGWMPEGASPDFNCFVWGQNVGGVPIWFNVNYNGVTGYYASFYDDSSYHSNEELTAKYGVPLCGQAPPATAPASPSPPAGSGGPASPPSPAAIYFSPFGRGTYEVGEGVTNLSVGTWGSQCILPRLAYTSAVSSLTGGGSIATLAGWSYGRVGVISFLANAPEPRLNQIPYALLIDPGAYGELGCDRFLHAGSVLGHWLRTNRGAHLVVISGSLSQSSNSKGIQESYFNAIRRGYADVSPRILICNYSVGHTDAFLSSKYWIQHRIGSTRNACPQLSVGGRPLKASAGWHPIN